jgi:Uma2 family endonuclease
MAFLVDEAHLPAILTVGPMTDEAFAQLCAEHPDLNLELSALGELIITPQTYTWTGARNNEISRQLSNWARQDKRGVAFDSSTGWLLPNTARRSPDAAWISSTASETWTRPPSAATGPCVRTL